MRIIDYSIKINFLTLKEAQDIYKKPFNGTWNH